MFIPDKIISRHAVVCQSTGLHFYILYKFRIFLPWLKIKYGLFRFIFSITILLHGKRCVLINSLVPFSQNNEAVLRAVLVIFACADFHFLTMPSAQNNVNVGDFATFESCESRISYIFHVIDAF